MKNDAKMTADATTMVIEKNTIKLTFDMVDEAHDKKLYIIKTKNRNCFPVELSTLQNCEEELVEIEKSAESTELTMSTSNSIVVNEKAIEAKTSEKTMDINIAHQ